VDDALKDESVGPVGLLLTTEAVVTEKPEPKGGAPAMPGGGGGMRDMY
jgi:chaperonin GroEL